MPPATDAEAPGSPASTRDASRAQSGGSERSGAAPRAWLVRIASRKPRAASNWIDFCRSSTPYCRSGPTSATRGARCRCALKPSQLRVPTSFSTGRPVISLASTKSSRRSVKTKSACARTPRPLPTCREDGGDDDSRDLPLRALDDFGRIEQRGHCLLVQSWSPTSCLAKRSGKPRRSPAF